MFEGTHQPIEKTSEEMNAVMGLLKEKYPGETQEVLAAAARVLQKWEETNGKGFGEEQAADAIARAREVRAEAAPNVAPLVDSDLNVMSRGTDPENERTVGK